MNRFNLTPGRWAVLVTLFGLWIRLFFVLNVQFPLNDGGMFLTMVQDLQRNHYLLPVFTTYNFSHIPFAYPLFPFYLAAGLSDILHIPVITILRMLPAIISGLTIPAVYGIALFILKKPSLALISAFIYSILPKSYEWIIMGGGLTRSIGFLFALAAIWCMTYALSRDDRRYTLAAGIFLGLGVMSHLEMALFGIYSVGLFWFFYERTKKGFVRLLTIYILAIITALPWLVTVIHLHGIAPVINATHTGFWTIYGLLPLVLFNITSEPFVGLIAVLAVLGLCASLITSQYILPVWLSFVFILNQRSPQNMGTVPLALLAAYGVHWFIIPVIKAHAGKRTTIVVLTFLTVYTLSMLIGMTYPQYSALQALSESNVRAMQWVKNNTPESSRFLVITELPAYAWYMERTAEWFPALARRTSPLTMQGAEWLPGNRFINLYKQRPEWKQCNNQPVSCFEKTAAKYHTTYQYLYIDLHDQVKTAPSCCSLLFQSLKTSSRYVKLYEEKNISVWKKISQRGK